MIFMSWWRKLAKEEESQTVAKKKNIYDCQGRWIVDMKHENLKPAFQIAEIAS